MLLKFILYLFVLKSGFGFRLKYPDIGDPKRQNDYEYHPIISGWMKLHAEPADWQTARVNCHMEGAFLASPWSNVFNNVLRDLMRKHLTDKMGNETLWLGVHASFDEGVLKSEQGNQIISLQHDDLVHFERCGVLRFHEIGKAHCDTLFPYVCYRPGKSAPISLPVRPIMPLPSSEETINPKDDEINPIDDEINPIDDEINPIDDEINPRDDDINPRDDELPKSPSEVVLTIDSSKCGDESLGYQFSELTGHCYKFHAHAVETWNLAKSACEEEGAYLAIVNSDEEVKVLKEIFAEKIYGANFTDTAAIGFYKDAINHWKTLDGESLESAGYNKWRPEAPHPEAHLGFIARDGLLYGYIQIKDVPYICEKLALKQDVNKETESSESKTELAGVGKDMETITETVTEEDEESSSTIDYDNTRFALHESIVYSWDTSPAPITKDVEETIESKYKTEPQQFTE